MGMRAGVVLSSKGGDVVTVAPDARVTDAVRLLARHGVGALVVSGDGERVDGILSERDIVRYLARSGAASLTLQVAEVMTADVFTCGPDTTVDELMALMTGRRIRHVPVVSDGRLVGIVSIGDVVKVRMDELEIEAETLQDYVTGSY